MAKRRLTLDVKLGCVNKGNVIGICKKIDVGSSRSISQKIEGIAINSAIAFTENFLLPLFSPAMGKRIANREVKKIEKKYNDQLQIKVNKAEFNKIREKSAKKAVIDLEFEYDALTYFLQDHVDDIIEFDETREQDKVLKLACVHVLGVLKQDVPAEVKDAVIMDLVNNMPQEVYGYIGSVLKERGVEIRIDEVRVRIVNNQGSIS